MAKFLTVGVIAAATGKLADVEYFAADLAPRADQTALRWTVTYSQLADVLEMTFDSGTTWVTVQTPSINTLTVFSFNVRVGDTINFRAGTDTTIDFFRVDAEIL
jgi:hypothetical protein